MQASSGWNSENLKVRGLDVALVEMRPQVMDPLDLEMAAFLHHELRRKMGFSYIWEKK